MAKKKPSPKTTNKQLPKNPRGPQKNPRPKKYSGVINLKIEPVKYHLIHVYSEQCGKTVSESIRDAIDHMLGLTVHHGELLP
jgi:hypothetical protein